MSNREDFEWYCRADMSEYRGKYVAIWNKSVAGFGDTTIEAYKMAKEKYPDSTPVLAFVPTTEAAIF